jgi:hypothetical protein
MSSSSMNMQYQHHHQLTYRIFCLLFQKIHHTPRPHEKVKMQIPGKDHERRMEHIDSGTRRDHCINQHTPKSKQHTCHKGTDFLEYHIVFDVNCNLRHKARLVVGSNWIFNDKEYNYSGFLRMDTIRIRFFLRELYGFSCCA